MKLPIGISDFAELVTENYNFADKSLFIKEIISDGAKVILITRPRRFGKTLNLSMLYHFLQANFQIKDNIFKDLNVAKDTNFCQQHQNKYPVIFVSFKDIKASSYENAYKDIIETISQLYENHRYLLEESILSQTEKNTFLEILNKKAQSSEIKSSLKLLTKHLSTKFSKPPILLIDEYDTPIQEAYLKGYYSEMIELMRSILGQALKDNTSLGKAIVTGITKISQESLFSGLNNIQAYGILQERYGQYFGFTEEEVNQFLLEGRLEGHPSIKKWYNGYQIGKYVLYNPWSIISCLSNNGKLQPYWLNTSSNELITKLVSNSDIVVKQKFELLLQGQIIEQAISENLVFPDLEIDPEALWVLLLYTGYLKVLSSEFRGNRLMAKIAIPNQEVSFVYDKIVERWFSLAISLESYDRFVQSLTNGDVEKFELYLATYIVQSGSYFDFNQNTPEQIFHVFILGLVVGLRDDYIISSNEESGLGRLDVAFIPKSKQKNGIILEFKIANTQEELVSKANQALIQIKEKQYFQSFKQHEIKNILAIGIAFCGKEVKVAHETLTY